MAEENVEKAEGVADQIQDPEQVFDEDGNEITDWKAIATRNTGIGKKYQSRFEKLNKEFEEYRAKNPEAKPQDKKQEKKEFDLAEKSYLLSNGVKREDIPHYWEEHQKTGQDIDTLLESPYFQEKLQKSNTAKAVPEGTKRSGTSPKDSVDYWLQKGELPPYVPENTELRRKVARARAELEKQGSKFTSRPIASS